MPLYIVKKDITRMNVDAIATTAKSLPEVGEGIDPIIYKAACYNRLLRERKRLGVISKGKVATTPAFRIPALGIIHTVFPKWEEGSHEEEKILRQCYRSILSEAVNKEFESVAIPFSNNDNFGFPKEIAITAALEEIRSFINTCDITVYLVVCDEYISVPSYDEEYPQIYYQMSSASICCDEASASCLTELEETICAEKTCLESEDVKYAVGVKIKDESLSFFSASCSEKPPTSLKDILEEDTPTFIDTLLQYMEEKKVDRVTLYTRSNLDRKRMSKLINGHIATPSKNMVLALVIGLRLNIKEAKVFMSYAGYAFSPADKTDRVVLYNLLKGNYDIDRINFDLYDNDLPSLGINIY